MIIIIRIVPKNEKRARNRIYMVRSSLLVLSHLPGGHRTLKFIRENFDNLYHEFREGYWVGCSWVACGQRMDSLEQYNQQETAEPRGSPLYVVNCTSLVLPHLHQHCRFRHKKFGEQGFNSTVKREDSDARP